MRLFFLITTIPSSNGAGFARTNPWALVVCYSLGTFIGATLFPGRVFGGDKYDPYTNTLQLHSDAPALALAAAFAKDVHSRNHPGGYCFVSGLPVFATYRQTQLTGEGLDRRERSDWDLEHEGYLVLYPQFGADVATMGMPLIGVWWAGPGARIGRRSDRTCCRPSGRQSPRQGTASRRGTGPKRGKSPDKATPSTAVTTGLRRSALRPLVVARSRSALIMQQGNRPVMLRR